MATIVNSPSTGYTANVYINGVSLSPNPVNAGKSVKIAADIKACTPVLGWTASSNNTYQEYLLADNNGYAIET